LRERLRIQLMLALYRSGRQAEALACYQEARRALVEELGIEPSREFQALQTAILRHDPDLDLGPTTEADAASSVGAAKPTGPHPPQEERRVVTVLFADLVGSAKSNQADPEDVAARLRLYQHRARGEIERLGGRIEKFVGDGVMAVFGAPRTHEDDAERAVRAALAVAEAVAELNEAHPDLGFAVRAAVNTGEAVVDLVPNLEAGESTVFGDVVNAASRLQYLAPPGGVLVGELTYRTTRDAIAYDVLQPVAARGDDTAFPVWRARAASIRPAAGERAERAPFVGRAEDLALLELTHSKTVRESSVQLVTVVGEAGMGKTRLVAEFRRALEQQPQGALWLQGRCLAYGEGITFWALGELVKAQAGILESDSREQAAAKLRASVEALVPEASEQDWFTARLAPLVGAESGDGAGTVEQGESFAAWRRFLEAVSAWAPLVVVIEDLHWADSALLEFVDHVLQWSVGVPMLVLCTARPELYERQADWGGGKRNATTISLSPLSPGETAQLISTLLPRAVLPAETQAALLKRAGGNPLYAQEFVRMLLDRGIVDSEAGVWATADEIPVPETVQAVIAARLDTLAGGQKSVLQDAAVIGKVFWRRAVAAVGDADEGAVETCLRELVARELVRPMRISSLRGQTEYAFTHMLIGDVAYGQIPRAARGKKHRAAAAWIARISEGRMTDHAEFLAYHYRQALELARVTGAAEEVEELEPLARRFLVLSGDRALKLDVAAADAYYSQALELFPSEAPERVEVLWKGAEAAWLAGRFSEAESQYEAAIADFRVRGDMLHAGEAMARLANALRDRGKTARARALLDEAIELLEREPRGPELAIAYLHNARDHNLSGRHAEALEWSEKALALSQRLGLENHAARALQFLGFLRFHLGDPTGVDVLREALRVTSGSGSATRPSLPTGPSPSSSGWSRARRRQSSLRSPQWTSPAAAALPSWATG
jgi:class 3 adenylate cyclase/tetratricopeptide (TPR) repeat protein